MRIHNILKNTKGFGIAYAAMLRSQSMHNKAEVERRAKILTFWKEYGDKATHDAFAVSRRTLFRWQEALAHGTGKLTALDPKSTAPNRKRRRHIPADIEAFIIKERTDHPRIGKKKLTPLLKKAGFAVPEATVGRYIQDLKKRNMLPVPTKLSFYAKSGTHKERLKPKQKKIRRKNKRGMEIDTVVRYVNGIKRYTLTAIDVRRRFSYARTYTTHSSASARDFLKRLIHYSPFDIDEIQTDNGSEFAKFFHEACVALAITHYHTYPRCPKMNAYIERFNRTISEEFLMYNRQLMANDVDAFNEKMNVWLFWYNHTRPHEGLGLLSPMEYILSIKGLECQM